MISPRRPVIIVVCVFESCVVVVVVVVGVAHTPFFLFIGLYSGIPSVSGGVWGLGRAWVWIGSGRRCLAFLCVYYLLLWVQGAPWASRL